MAIRLDLFTRFGGVRAMAGKLGLGPSTISDWKRARRVPSHRQAFVLQRGAELQLDLTAEDVMFPFPEDRALA